MQYQKSAKDCRKNVDSGEITPKKKQGILSRLIVTGDISEAKEVDFVIEAIVEDMEQKKHFSTALNRFFQKM